MYDSGNTKDGNGRERGISRVLTPSVKWHDINSPETVIS